MGCYDYWKNTMSVFNTAYDTLACSAYSPAIAQITKQLEDALVTGMLEPSPITPKVRFLKEVAGVSNNIPAFAHPIYIRNPRSPDEEVVVVDLRFYGSIDQRTQQFTIRNQAEANLATNRAYLNAVWLFSDPKMLQSTSPLGMSVYASWIGEFIAKRLSLNPKEQLMLTILAAYFYCCQFDTTGEFDEDERRRLASYISRNVPCSVRDAQEVIGEELYLHNLNEFCAATYDATKAITMKNFNSRLLFETVKGSWFGGTNPRELVAVALEHPPTMLAIILAAIEDRSYRSTVISRLVERKAGKENDKNFVRAINGLIQQTFASY